MEAVLYHVDDTGQRTVRLQTSQDPSVTYEVR